MGLQDYRRKRDFSQTPEPAGKVAKARKRKPSFVVQKHAARRLHYDFRLEMDGVLKSWAVPKGPSLDPGAKRLAVHVEDHPIDYGGFEGVIPQGEYGGGTVRVWDRGWWEPIGDADAGYAKGDLKFTLHGEKLNGGFALVRMRNRRDRDKGDNWLLIKERDAAAKPGSDDAVLAAANSAATGRDMAAIANASDRVWSSKSGEVKTKQAPKKKAPAGLGKIPGARRAKSAPEISPQLANVAPAAPAGEAWLHEIKFDGYRLLAHVRDGKVVLRTRNGLDWTKRFPELAEAFSRLELTEALFDGEVVHLTAGGATSFSALQDDLAERRTGTLIYMAFDLLFLDGWDLTGAKLEDRKAALRSLLQDRSGAKIRYSDHQLGKGEAFFSSASRFGLEGIVSKRRDAPYRPGRGAAWLKVKCGTREELVVVGFTDPAGKRQGFGALLAGYYTPKGKLVFAGGIGTGYSTKILSDLRKTLDRIERKRPTVALPAGLSSRGFHWVEPELVAEVGFADWTKDGMLRQASFLGIREDKKATEIVLDPRDGASRQKNSPARDLAEIRKDGSATVRGVRITHADKVLYPARNISKLDIASYYAEVAELILPNVVHRPLSLLRCPDGVDGQHFFQKHISAGLPDGIKSIATARESVLVIEDVTGLLELAQLAVLEIHPWGSTIDDIERPDRLIFDLDPDEGLGWNRVKAAAIAVRDLLDELGLRGFAKTTGGKGLHVVVPIKPTLDWSAAKAFTLAVAARLAADEPGLYTVSMAKKARHGKIFVDYLRNGRGATAVAAYSTRARPGATVSVPLSWDEVERGIRSDQFTIANLPQRLRSLKDDPWADLARTKQTITSAMRKEIATR